MAYRVLESSAQLSFVRKAELFSVLALLLSGFMFLGFGALRIEPGDFYDFPNSLHRFLPCSIGLVMALAAFMVNYGNRSIPRKIVFDRIRSLILFEGNSPRKFVHVPFSNVAGFEIEVEKKRPSVSNSATMDHTVYHLILIWKSMGAWHLTESTDRAKMDLLAQRLQEIVTSSSPSDYRNQNLASSITIIAGINQTTIRWKSQMAVPFAALITLCNVAFIGSIWWLLTHSASIATSIFITMGIILFGLIILGRFIAPGVFHNATTIFQMDVSSAGFQYSENSRLRVRQKIKKCMASNELKSIAYTYSLLHLGYNSILMFHAHEPGNSFEVSLAGLDPMDCLALELLIKDDFKRRSG